MTWNMTPTYKESVTVDRGEKEHADTARFSYLPAGIACPWNKHRQTKKNR